MLKYLLIVVCCFGARAEEEKVMLDGKLVLKSSLKNVETDRLDVKEEKKDGTPACVQ